MHPRFPDRRKFIRAGIRVALCGILASAVFALASSALCAQQPAPGQPPAAHSAKAPSDIAARVEAVRVSLRAGRITEALKTANELSARNKNDVQVHFALGALLLSEKQYKPARIGKSKRASTRQFRDPR
jgi:hypothetical protein